MFKLFTVISIGMYVIPASLPPLLKDIIQGEEMLGTNNVSSRGCAKNLWIIAVICILQLSFSLISQ